MEILEATLQNIRQIVDKHAKYQKVMLVYDQFVLNSHLLAIYNEIKGCCIFNQMCTTSNLEEVYNGYKLVIFLCSANSFLGLDIALDDFVCVFIPTDNSILPYFLDGEFKLNKRTGFLLITANNLDPLPICSVLFNNFYNYLHQLVYTGGTNVVFNFNFGNITQKSILNMINQLDDNYQFYDVKILKRCKIDYADLALLDYILVCAFTCFVDSVRENSLEFVDIYKAVGENYDLLDRYYAALNNKVLNNIIKLNYTGLNLAGKQTKESLLNFIFSANKDKIDGLICKIKTYAKFSDDLLNYLYLYNMFSV